jgi:membrane protease YdiL (CAAX protease family)
MAIAVLRSPDGRLRPIWRFLIAVILAFVCQLGVGLLLRPATLVGPASLIGFAIVLSINLSIFWALSLTLDRATQPMPYIGFSTHVPFIRLIAAGFVCGAAMVSLAVLVIAIGGTTSFRFRLDGAMLQAAALQLLLFPVAALHEEALFRGYPFQRLAESIGAWPAVIVVSLLFAVPHLFNPNSTLFGAFNTAAVGALLAAAYLLTRSLWLPWGIHWGWNFVLAVAYGLSVSGFDTDGPVDGGVTGPVWLTGGAYGIEGGASGTVAIVVGFGVLLWLVRQPALVGVAAPAPLAYVMPSSSAALSSPPSSSPSSPPSSSSSPSSS